MAETSATVLVANLTKLDPDALSRPDVNSLLSYFYDFLVEVKGGLERWETNNTNTTLEHVYAPFLRDGRGSSEYYNLVFLPRSYQVSFSSGSALYLVDIARVLDEIFDWLTKSLPAADAEIVNRYLSDSSVSQKLLTGNDFTAVNDESLIATGSWRTQFRTKLAQEIAFIAELQAQNQQVTPSSLNQILDFIGRTSDENILVFWQSPIPDSRSIKDWLTLFQELEVGSLILASPLNTLVPDLRKLSNIYTMRLNQVAMSNAYASQLSAASSDVRAIANRLRNKPLYFTEPETNPPEKTSVDQQTLTQEVPELDALVEALRVGVSVGEKLIDLIKPAKREPLNNEAASGQGGETDSISPAGTARVVPPTSANAPQQPTPTANALSVSSQAFTIEAGFISVQVLGELSSIYGIPYAELPPDTIREVQESVRVKLLSRLSTDPSIATQSRFQLGQDIVHEVLSNDVSLLYKLRQEIANTAAEKKLTLTNQDPLNLNQSSPEQRVALYDQIKLNAAPEADTPEAEAARQVLAQAAAQGAYSRTLIQNDQQLSQALTELNISSASEQLVIKNLVASYIYSFGIGPEELFSNISDQQLAGIFGVNIPMDQPEQIALFRQVVSGYWEYQKTYLEATTGHRFIANPNLLRALQYQQLNPAQMSRLTLVATQNASLFAHDQQAFRDPRLRLMATQVTSFELNDPASQKKLLDSLESLYPNLDAKDRAESAGRSFEVIRDLQTKQTAFFTQQIAEQINREQMRHFILVAQQRADLTAVQEQILNDALVAYQMNQLNELDFAHQVAQNFALQQLMLLGNYQDVEAQDFNQPSPGLLGRLRQFRQSRSGASSLANGLKQAKQLASSAEGLAAIANPRQLAAMAAGQIARRLFGEKAGAAIEDLISKVALASFLAGLLGSLFTFLSSLSLPAILIGGGIAAGLADIAGRLINSATSSNVIPANSFGTQTAQASANPATNALSATRGAIAPANTVSSFFSSGSHIGSLAVGTATIGVTILAAVSIAGTDSALLKPFGTQIQNGSNSPLGLSKSAFPSTNVGPDQDVVYTLKVTGNLGNFTNVVVTDAIATGDESKIVTNSISEVVTDPGVTCQPTATGLTCNIPSLLQDHSTSISYKLHTSSSVTSDGKTPITNDVKATGDSDKGPPPVTSTSSLTLNSDGQIIADKSIEITGRLVKGWWGFYNFDPQHPLLYNLKAWNDDLHTQNQTPVSFTPGAAQFACKDPAYSGPYPCIESTGANDMFWCTWNVIYAYFEAGRPLVSPDAPGSLTGVAGMRRYFQNNVPGNAVYIPEPTADQIKVGDVAFFEKGANEFSAHVSIVTEVTSTYIRTSDSNNVTIQRTYTINNGVVEPLGIVRLNAVGRLE